jgi:hypothetical protein
MNVTAAMRCGLLGALLVSATLASGCGSTARIVQSAAPAEAALRVAASEALTLHGLALDSCSAWRLVSLESTRNDRVAADRWATVADHLAEQYGTVLASYETHRSNLGPVLFLPPAGSLIASELGECWV